MAEVAGAASRDEIRHREAVDRVRKGAERVVDRARARAQADGGPIPDASPAG